MLVSRWFDQMRGFAFFGIGISISILDYGQAESITNTDR